MSIAEQLSSSWSGRSTRERVLLLAMAAVLGALVAWYGIAMPLRGLASGASAQLQRAAETESIVQSAMTLDLKAGATVEEILASAAPEGLMVDRHSAAPGEITLWAKAPNAAALFRWLGTLQQRFGIAVSNLSVTPDNDGALAVEAVLIGGGS